MILRPFPNATLPRRTFLPAEVSIIFQCQVYCDNYFTSHFDTLTPPAVRLRVSCSLFTPPFPSAQTGLQELHKP